MLGTSVRLCDFHKEQAWNRWLSASRNGVDASDKESVLALLRNISHADSESAVNAAVAYLKQSRWWKANTSFRNWFSRKWLPHSRVSFDKPWFV